MQHKAGPCGIICRSAALSYFRSWRSFCHLSKEHPGLKPNYIISHPEWVPLRGHFYAVTWTGAVLQWWQADHQSTQLWNGTLHSLPGCTWWRGMKPQHCHHWSPWLCFIVMGLAWGFVSMKIRWNKYSAFGALQQSVRLGMELGSFLWGTRHTGLCGLYKVNMIIESMLSENFFFFWKISHFLSQTASEVCFLILLQTIWFLH